MAFVEPSPEKGRSRWQGSGQPMHLDLCQAIARTLTEETFPITLSRRGQTLLESLREEFTWLESGKTCMVHSVNELRWWNFAGGLFNNWMASCLNKRGFKANPDNFFTTIKTSDTPLEIKQALAACLNTPGDGDEDEPKKKWMD